MKLLINEITSDVFTEIEFILGKNHNSIEKDLIPSNKTLNSYFSVVSSYFNRYANSQTTFY